MKTCSKCKITKPLDEFHRRVSSTDGRQVWCKPCNLEARKANYRHPGAREKTKAYNREYGRANRRRIIEYLMSHPCVDCGVRDHVVLEFDHRDPDSKEFNISRAVRYPWLRILAEIEKCDVRCANCHRRKTAVQFGWYTRV